MTKTSYTPDTCNRVCALLEANPDITFAEIAHALGVNRQTMIGWRHRHPEFEAIAAKVCTSHTITPSEKGIGDEKDVKGLTKCVEHYFSRSSHLKHHAGLLPRRVGEIVEQLISDGYNATALMAMSEPERNGVIREAIASSAHAPSWVDEVVAASTVNEHSIEVGDIEM